LAGPWCSAQVRGARRCPYPSPLSPQVEIADSADQDASRLAEIISSIVSVSLPSDDRQPRSETVKLPETVSVDRASFAHFRGLHFPRTPQTEKCLLTGLAHSTGRKPVARTADLVHSNSLPRLATASRRDKASQSYQRLLRPQGRSAGRIRIPAPPQVWALSDRRWRSSAHSWMWDVCRALL
jgi:hypothetical protein